MNGTMKRAIAVAGKLSRAVFLCRTNGGLGLAGAWIPCAAGVAALLLAACANAPKRTGSFRDCPHCPEMVILPAGGFMMGSPDSEAGRDNDEGPRRRVRIPRPFAVGKYEVTNEEYAAFLATNSVFPVPKTHGSDRHPVTGVRWHEAKAYVAWLSRETGYTYRLLSESEWEYAARAGTQTAYHWGDDIGANNARCNACGTRRDGERWSVAVGSFPPNDFGLHDMNGNVWEWVEDCYGGYADAPSGGRPRVVEDCGIRVRRGGSWADPPMHLRSASRLGIAAGYRNDLDGFRVARTN